MPKLFSALPTLALAIVHTSTEMSPCHQETTPFTATYAFLTFETPCISPKSGIPRHWFLDKVPCLTIAPDCPFVKSDIRKNIGDTVRRFLVLCHFRTPDVFTVQAGFHLPGAGSGSIGPAEVDRSSRDLRWFPFFYFCSLSTP